MKKNLLIMVFIALCINTYSSECESLVYVQSLSQTELMQVASSIGKMTFEDGHLVVYGTNHVQLLSVELTEDCRIIVGDKSVDINGEEFEISTDSKNVKQNFISVYPNPATDNITIEGVTNGSPIMLISMNGEIISRKIVKQAVEMLNVSTLASGMYLLVINNQVIKLIKK